MSIRIYNSLTKRKEKFVPIGGDTINMYSCGVTVYDQCHIGHARSLYIIDVIRRYLKYRGYNVRFVRNITDIDDKIINKARELDKSSSEIACDNICSYYEDLKGLGIDKAEVEPKATDNIAEMIEHIQRLIDQGFAYEIEGDVYFNVRKFVNYGQLSGQSIEQMREAVRIEKGARKKDPLDFALWKQSKQGEPSWESPWGQGRPGWHIECSVMSLKHLNCKTLDIHAGGRDLIFPHHENEIAQVEALTEKPFAKYWLHHGLLTINGQKMAKSLGNYITIQEALKKYSVNELKMFFLSSQYSSPVDFTDGRMGDAHKAMQRFEVLRDAVLRMNPNKAENVGEVNFIEKCRNGFLEAMDDDFNTPQALGHLFEFIKETNKFIERGKKDDAYHAVIQKAWMTVCDLTRDIFGLLIADLPDQMTDEIAILLAKRQKARANKNFKLADELRSQLKEKGVIVEDLENGQQRYRWA